MQSRSSLRVLSVAVLLFVTPCIALLAQDGTLAGQLQTEAIASDLQGTTSPARSPAAVPAPTNAPPASLQGSAEVKPYGAPASSSSAQTNTRAAAPAATPAPAASTPQVERAYGYRNRGEGPVLQALHHVSEYRFFYSAGFTLFNLLALMSVNTTSARRMFGTFSIIGLLFVLHYVFIGVAIPPLRPEAWRGPLQRRMGIRTMQEWERVPDIGTSLFVIREKNFLGPKNETPMSEFFNQVISERSAGQDAKLEYAEEFVTHGIRWLPAKVTDAKGRMLYFWAAEFKQQRIIIELSIGSSHDADRDLREIVALVGNIK